MGRGHGEAIGEEMGRQDWEEAGSKRGHGEEKRNKERGVKMKEKERR